MNEFSLYLFFDLSSFFPFSFLIYFEMSVLCIQVAGIFTIFKILNFYCMAGGGMEGGEFAVFN